jgi:hypothetical protein
MALQDNVGGARTFTGGAAPYAYTAGSGVDLGRSGKRRSPVIWAQFLFNDTTHPIDPVVIGLGCTNRTPFPEHE